MKNSCLEKDLCNNFNRFIISENSQVILTRFSQVKLTHPQQNKDMKKGDDFNGNSGTEQE